MKKIDPKREAQIKASPTCYVFDLLDVPMQNYVDVLTILFRDAEFKKLVEKRNRMVKSAGDMKLQSAEITNIVRVITQVDRKLADTLFATIVQANLRSSITYESVPFDTMMQEVDMSQKGMPEKVDNLKSNLDKLVFLSDMLESVFTDIKGDMTKIFAEKYEFKQFDGVRATLNNMRTFFGEVRSPETNSPRAELYMEYADSINDYLSKRLKTYSEKARKLNTKK